MEAGLVFTSPLIRLRFGCLKIGKGGVSWSSTPVSSALNFPAVNDTESAFQQFAAALNSTDNEQLMLLQSILRQQGYLEQASTALPSRQAVRQATLASFLAQPDKLWTSIQHHC